MNRDFNKTIKKNLKNVQFSIFLQFATTVLHTVISNSEKLTHPKLVGVALHGYLRRFIRLDINDWVIVMK